MRRSLHPSQVPIVRLSRNLGTISRNCTFAYRLHGNVDATILSQAYIKSLAKFDALSLALVEDAALGYWWEDNADCRVIVEIRDAVGQDEAVIVSASQGETFDLSIGPLGRILLLRTGPEEWLVSEAFDHAVADAPSLALLHEAVEAFYNQTPLASFGSYLTVLDRELTKEPLKKSACDGVTFEGWSENNARGMHHEDQSVVRTIPLDLQRKIETSARNLGVTPAAIFLSAFSHAICRAKGISGINVSVTVDTREHDDKRTFGQFARLIPSQPFRSWRDTLLESALYTSEQLYEIMEDALTCQEPISERGMPTSLLAPNQALFVFQNEIQSPPNLSGCQASQFFTKDLSSAGGINCFVRQLSSGQSSFEIRTPKGSYFHNTASIVSEIILNHLTLFPERSSEFLLSEDLLPSQDRSVIAGTRDLIEPFPYVAVERLILSTLKFKRQTIVLETADVAFTGGELRDRIAFYMRGLRRLSAGAGDLIAVGEAPIFDRISAYLAALRSGGTYFPFEGDIETIKFASSHVTIVIHDGVFRRVQRRTNRNFCQIAYVIFTSGSTGRPKGVLINRHALSNLIQGERMRFSLNASARVLLIAPPIADPWICHVSAGLAFGAVIIAADLMGVNSLSDFLEINQISHAFLPAALLAQVEDRMYPHLRVLASAGDHCRPADAERFKDRHFQFYNIYGPTEATVTATVHTVAQTSQYIPIGRAIMGMEAFVLIDGEAKAPVGVIGELYLSGVQLSNGYLGDPDETKQRFINVAGGTEKRCYKTGDMGYLNQHGEIVLTGRLDRQVKVRGFRVEPDAIETAARGSGLCTDAYVKIFTTVPHNDLEKRLILFVSDCADPDSLMEHLRRSTSPSHWPHVIEAVKSLPRNPAGKIAEDKLTFSGFENFDTRPLFDGEEQLIAGVWREVLGTTPTSDSSFFELGGDSLSVLRVVRKLRLSGYDIEPRDVYRSPVLENLAKNLRPKKLEAPPRGPSQKEENLGPMESWFWHQDFVDPNKFTQKHVIYFKNQLSPIEVKQVYERIVRTEPAFRFVYNQDHRTKSLLSTLDFRSKLVTVNDDDPVSLTRAFAEVNSWIAPMEGRLIGAIALNASFGSCLILVAHHLAVDEWSWTVIEDRVFDFLQTGAISGDEDVGAHRAVPSAYSEALAMGAFTREAVMWMQTLRLGKTSRMGRQLGELRQLSHHIPLEEASARGKRRLSASLVLGTLSAALHSHEGEGTTVIDLERNARTAFGETDTSRAVGWFASHHPIAIRHRSPHDLEDTVAEISSQLDSIPNAGLPYVLSRWAATKSPYGAEVGRFSLNVTEAKDHSNNQVLKRHIDKAKQSAQGSSNRLPYDASISIRSSDEGVEIEFQYDLSRIDESAASDLAKQMGLLIKSYLSETDLPSSTSRNRTKHYFAQDLLVPASVMQKLMIQETLRWRDGTYLPSQIIRVDHPLANYWNAERCQALLESIDAFGMRFVNLNGALFVRWADIPACALTEYYGGLDEAREWISQETRTGFSNLCQQGLPFKVGLFRREDDPLYIAMVCHHAILDGVSNDRLLSLLTLQGGEASRIRDHGRESFLRKLSLEENQGGRPHVIRCYDSLQRTWVTKQYCIEDELDSLAKRWCATHQTDLKALIGGVLLAWLHKTHTGSKLLVVTNGRDGAVPGMEDAIGHFWYFRRIAAASEDVISEAKMIIDITSSRVSETQKILVNEGVDTSADLISYNFLKQHQRPKQGIEVIASQDIFHTPIQVTVRVDERQKITIDVRFAADHQTSKLDIVEEIERALNNVAARLQTP